MSEDDDDESDKHLEARDRRYSCLKLAGKFKMTYTLGQTLGEEGRWIGLLT